MPTYEYECEKCKIRFEISHSIKQPPLEDCPKCKAVKSLERLISEPFMIIDKTPKTLGSMADKNNRTMGKYKLEDKIQENIDRKNKAQDKLLEESEKITGVKPVDKRKIKKSWFNKDSNNPTKLAKLTKEQKKNYIEKGKLP